MGAGFSTKSGGVGFLTIAMLVRGAGFSTESSDAGFLANYRFIQVEGPGFYSKFIIWFVNHSGQRMRSSS